MRSGGFKSSPTIPFLVIILPEKEEFSSVLVTCGSMEKAKAIAKDLINKRLAACANIWTVDSIYRWQGEVEESPEVMMLLKVRTEDFKEVCDSIRRLHDYEVPCVVRYDIADGLDIYLRWIHDVTER
ncbi:MAG: divalent-cation tolerance protein CutA [Methanomassiliicoccales archaeon]|nr:MAG: divalent-cation tolerance protein CutA [Methanomassiliicoccales archaeon]